MKTSASNSPVAEILVAYWRSDWRALLSVAAVGPAEAWAVGMDGGVLQAKGDVVRALHLERVAQPAAEPAEEQRGDDRHYRHTQFVGRRDLRAIAQFSARK